MTSDVELRLKELYYCLHAQKLNKFKYYITLEEHLWLYNLWKKEVEDE